MYLWQNRSKQSVPFIENSDISSFGRTLVFPKITTGKNASLNDLKRICEQKEKKTKKKYRITKNLQHKLKRLSEQRNTPG